MRTRKRMLGGQGDDEAVSGVNEEEPLSYGTWTQQTGDQNKSNVADVPPHSNLQLLLDNRLYETIQPLEEEYSSLLTNTMDSVMLCDDLTPSAPHVTLLRPATPQYQLYVVQSSDSRNTTNGASGSHNKLRENNFEFIQNTRLKNISSRKMRKSVVKASKETNTVKDYIKRKRKEAAGGTSSSHYDIMNIKSIYTEELEKNSVELIPDSQTLPINEYNEPANQLMKIVEQNQMEFFTTDDKDTFVISVSGDVNPDHLKRLLTDGMVSIHLDEDDTGGPVAISEVTDLYLNDGQNGILNQWIEIVEQDGGKINDRLNTDIVVTVADDIGSILTAPDDENKPLCAAGDTAPIQDTTQCRGEVVPPYCLPVQENTRDEGRKYSCKKCDKKFHKKDNYLCHKGTHNAKHKRHKCRECGEKFSWKTSLERHVASEHSTKESCPLCSKTFTNKSQVNVHIRRVHIKERRFSCPVANCNKTFFNNYGLALHIRSHTGHRPHLCGICGLKFNHPSHRRRHEYTHSILW